MTAMKRLVRWVISIFTRKRVLHVIEISEAEFITHLAMEAFRSGKLVSATRDA